MTQTCHVWESASWRNDNTFKNVNGNTVFQFYNMYVCVCVCVCVYPITSTSTINSDHVCESLISIYYFSIYYFKNIYILVYITLKISFKNTF